MQKLYETCSLVTDTVIYHSEKYILNSSANIYMEKQVKYFLLLVGKLYTLQTCCKSYLRTCTGKIHSRTNHFLKGREIITAGPASPGNQWAKPHLGRHSTTLAAARKIWTRLGSPEHTPPMKSSSVIWHIKEGFLSDAHMH